MITVWGRRSSSNVQAVMWCLEELGIHYNRIDAGFTYGLVDSEAYLTMNPNGTVPTIQDGESPPIWESGAILRYLANRYADDDFWPSKIVDRVRVDIQFAHVLFRYYDIPIDRKKLYAVEEYYDRIRQRPAYQQHVVISYSELADTK